MAARGGGEMKTLGVSRRGPDGVIKWCGCLPSSLPEAALLTCAHMLAATPQEKKKNFPRPVTATTPPHLLLFSSFWGCEGSVRRQGACGQRRASEYESAAQAAAAAAAVSSGVLSGASGPVNQPRSAVGRRDANRDISFHGPGAPPSLRLLPANH